MHISQKILRFVSSTTFFWIVLGAFLFESVWLALTAQYPMAFDEQYHFGIIKIYAQQLSPFIHSQPAGTSSLGELPNLASYFYHYLMSFVYRFFELFSSNQTFLIIALRMVDIAMFGAGIWFFRRLLMRIGTSPAVTHFVLLLLILVPVVPLLAAEMNYDNLVFLMVPIFLLFFLRVIRHIHENGELFFSDLAWLVIIACLSGIVKYAFLPFVAGGAILIAIYWLVSKHRFGILKSLGMTFRQMKLWSKIGLIAALVVSLGLFVQRYGTNIIEYHQVDPDCAKVLSVDDCLDYGPWARDYNLHQQVIAGAAHADKNFFKFEAGWIGGMIYRLYFTINYNYDTQGPLSVQIWLVIIAASLGAIFSIIFWRRIHKAHPHLWMLLVICGVYILSLQAVNYQDFLKTAQMVAINGRYLILLLPILLVTFAFGYQEFIKQVAGKHTLPVELIVAGIVLLLALDGGGIGTFLIYSNEQWYWHNDPLTPINQWAHSTLSRIIIGGTKSFRLIQ